MAAVKENPAFYKLQNICLNACVDEAALENTHAIVSDIYSCLYKTVLCLALGSDVILLKLENKHWGKPSISHLEHPASEQSLVQTDGALDRVPVGELDVGKAVVADTHKKRKHFHA